jgi:hypothetical protein
MQQDNYSFVEFPLCILKIDEQTKDSELNGSKHFPIEICS